MSGSVSGSGCNSPGRLGRRIFTLNFSIDRRQAARFGINVADVQDAIETAVGG